MMLQPSQSHSHLKYNINGKGWYFRFDDDNKMRYKDIFSIILGTAHMLHWTFVFATKEHKK